jgi:3-deoxy-manno-octulosonate cytidylyltransferase (CMP-KDO synthetase)
MIERVWRQALKINDDFPVVVVTDDHRIYDHMQRVGAAVEMTSASHINGSDRIAEYTKQFPGEYMVLNLQGDLPMVDPCVCRCLLDHLRSHKEAQITTPVIGMESMEDFENPNVVKAIFDLDFKALYFSRKPIPGENEEFRAFGPQWYRHIGLYAYRNYVLQELSCSAPTALEKQEKLEQLRALELGYHIRVVPVINDCGPDINCPEDLEKVNGLTQTN